jgi:uncharacterized protein (DUF4415 family)
MKIVWDEPKRLMNLAKHGLDFAELDPEFFSEAALGSADKGRLCCSWRMGRDRDHGGLQTSWRRGCLCHFHAAREPKGAKTMTSKKFSSNRPLTDDEEAEIQRMIASDPDNPELTDEQIAGLRPFGEVLPALAESARRGPGRPKLDRTLEPVTLRLDRSVVEHFRAQGADWRKRMARVLAKAAS